MSQVLAERRRAPQRAPLHGDGLVQRVLLQPAWLLALEVGLLFLPLVVFFALRLHQAAGGETDEQIELRLRQLALAAAATVDGDLHETIREPGQVDSDAYRAMLRPLAHFQNAVPGIRNLYTMREDDGRLRFVLDTARAPELLRPTDPPAAALSLLDFDLGQEPDLLRTLRAGQTYIDGRAYTSAKSSIAMRSVEAPIRNARGEVVAFLSLDFEESYLNRQLFEAGGVMGPLLLSLSVLTVLAIAGLVYWLRARIGDSLRALDRAVKTDALTGLYNRRHFNRCLAREVSRAAESGAPLSLLVFDADHFKRINDTWGHPAGDAVLRRIGESLRAATPYPRRAFRIGGEEFAVLLRGERAAQAMALYRELSATIRRPVEIAGTRLEVTVSGGVSELGRAEDGDRLLSRADQALYVAKNSGRDFAVVAAAV